MTLPTLPELGRYAKAVCAFLGAVLTFALGLPALGLPAWIPAVAAILTFVSTYGVPNKTVEPDGSADDVEEDVEEEVDDEVEAPEPDDTTE